MQKTQRLRPFEDSGPNRGTMPIVVGSSFAVLAVGYALLVLQPELVRQLAADIRTVVPGGPHWAVPAMASGIAIGGAAIAVFVLARFARGVQSAPYVWFAPVLVGFSTVVMGRLPVALPFNQVPTELFALLTAFMWLGGGALMQLPGLPARASGAILFTMPAIGLIVAYAQQAGGLPEALAQLKASDQFFMFVFWLTWLGVGMLSVVTRDAGPQVGSRDHRLAARAMEHARKSEERAAEAEQRASLAQEEVRVLRANQAGFGALADDAALEAMTHRGPTLPVTLGVGALAVTLLAAAGYFGAYQPLQKRTGAQLAAAKRAVQTQQAAVAAVQDELATERSRWQQELAAAQAKAAEAESALAQSETRLAELQGAGEGGDGAAGEAAAEAEAKKARRARAEKRARAAQRRKTAQRRKARRAKQQAARAQRRQERELPGNVSDDPIAGIDGL